MFKSNASPMSSFMGMVLTFLGIVLWATLFDTILAQFDILMGYVTCHRSRCCRRCTKSGR